MTSHLLYKTRCPKCAESGRDRSGDNLGIYSDGHSFCYSCGYTTGATVSGKLNKQTKQHKELQALPEDTATWLSPEAMEWLHKYFNNTADFPICYWSESERKLIFPIMDKQMTHMLAWQYRYLGTNPSHPKWVGYGITEELLYLQKRGARCTGRIVLVEDILSTHKVGHISPTLCLFGSHISLKRLVALKLLGYTEIVIWLDWDKRDYAIKAAQLAQSIGLKARVIHTQLDPKEFSYEQIKNHLG